MHLTDYDALMDRLDILDRSWPCLCAQRQRTTSGWRLSRVRHDRGPSRGESVIQLLGHLLSTAVVYMALFTFAWSLSFLCTTLNRLHPLPEERRHRAVRLLFAGGDGTLRQGDPAMKDALIVPFVEGFKDGIRLAITLVTAIATTIVTVFSDFVNRAPNR
jgi:hypothetical protein